MRLNTLKPAEGSKKVRVRVGRGIGSGLGKTAGRGHKGQKARKGGYHKVGFEGGQMPLQRRLPKFGFTSRKSLVSEELALSELNYIDAPVVDIAALQMAGLIKKSTKFVKVVLSGKIQKKFDLKGLKVTKGVREAIEALGGKIED
jgi:large subunit ribosomal protein L15